MKDPCKDCSGYVGCKEHCIAIRPKNDWFVKQENKQKPMKIGRRIDWHEFTFQNVPKGERKND